MVKNTLHYFSNSKSCEKDCFTHDILIFSYSICVLYVILINRNCSTRNKESQKGTHQQIGSKKREKMS